MGQRIRDMNQVIIVCRRGERGPGRGFRRIAPLRAIATLRRVAADWHGERLLRRILDDQGGHTTARGAGSENLRTAWARLERQIERDDLRVFWRADPMVPLTAFEPEEPPPVEEATTAAPVETFIEIQLVDMICEPVPNERYRITMPDGGVREGALDYRGRARVDGIEQSGQCRVTFPDLDQDAWRSEVICPEPPATQKRTWVEIELVNMADEPVAGERYRIKLPNGQSYEGRLDEHGRARYGLVYPAGECEITFPDLDAAAWEGIVDA